VTNATLQRYWVSVASGTNNARTPARIWGKLKDHINARALAMVTDKDPDTDCMYVAAPGNGWVTNAIYSAPWDTCSKSFTYYGDNYTNLMYRNPTFVLKDIPQSSAWSAVPSYGIAWRNWPSLFSGDHYKTTAQAITRRHAICATHNATGLAYEPHLLFYDTNGVLQVAVATDAYSHPWLDITMYYFATPLPDSVVPFTILPYSGHPDRLKFSTATSFSIDQWKKVLLSPPTSVGWPWNWIRNAVCGGDSGSMAAFLVENELVLNLSVDWSELTNMVAILNARNGTDVQPVMFSGAKWD